MELNSLPRGVLEGQDGFLDDVHALSDLVLLDDERRGQSDDVTMGGLGQQSVVTEVHAHPPSIVVWGGTHTSSSWFKYPTQFTEGIMSKLKMHKMCLKLNYAAKIIEKK